MFLVSQRKTLDMLYEVSDLEVNKYNHSKRENLKESTTKRVYNKEYHLSQNPHPFYMFFCHLNHNSCCDDFSLHLSFSRMLFLTLISSMDNSIYI